MNYYHIIQELIRVSAETGLDRKELVLVVDFKPDEAGLIPALGWAPDNFTIGSTKEYTEDDRPSEPDWFRRNVEGSDYEAWIVNWVNLVKETYHHLDPESDLLGLIRMVDGRSMCSTVNLSMTEVSKSLFSDEALDAFGKFLLDGNVSTLTASGLWNSDHADWLKAVWTQDHQTEK